MRIVAVMRASRKPSEPCKVVGVYVRAFRTGSYECFTRPRADAGPTLASRSTAARRADDMAVPVRARRNADLLRSRSERATHATGIPTHLAQAALRSGLQRALSKGIRYPAGPPTIEEIVRVMRTAGKGRGGARLRMIVVLWPAGLRTSEGSTTPVALLSRRPASPRLRCSESRALARAGPSDPRATGPRSGADGHRDDPAGPFQLQRGVSAGDGLEVHEFPAGTPAPGHRQADRGGCPGADGDRVALAQPAAAAQRGRDRFALVGHRQRAPREGLDR